ncbi:MAG TPA: hypothetical protein VFF29_02130 [Bacteroidota bacterium]|nr:hypothetical protein [Bacteroidota bacterium]
MKIIIIILSTFLFAVNSRAQVGVPTQEHSTELERAVYGLGVSAGYVSGFGLSFRHHLSSPFSYQIVGGIIKIDKALHYNLGSVIEYDLVRGETTRFYTCGGAGYFYSGESGGNDLDGPFRFGVGIGIEKSRLEALSISGEFMFTFFSDGTVLPLPQISFHYYFY